MPSRTVRWSSRNLLVPVLFALPLVSFVACSTSESAAPESSGTDDSPVDSGTKKKKDAAPKTADDASSDDSGTAEDGSTLPSYSENEPNNGALLDGGALQVNSFSPPGTMSGTISPADDVDAFGLGLDVGTVWSWQVVPAASLAPLLFVTDNRPDSDPDGAPNTLVKGMAGETILQEQFVFASRTYYGGIGDSRAAGSKVGGGYTLSVTQVTRTPVQLQAGKVVKATLASRGAIDLYGITAAGGNGWDLDIRAHRKTPASDMDSFVSIYDTKLKKRLLSHDDISLTESDSHVGTSIATGSYVVVVSNLTEAPTDLSYEIELTPR